MLGITILTNSQHYAAAYGGRILLTENVCVMMNELH